MEETTPEEEIDLANELLDAGYIELSKVCQPRFSFSLESRDATKQYEFKDQMRLLELGKIITIEKEEGLWYYPALLEISLNLDNSEEFSMTFANAMRLDDWGYTYADLISDASSTSRKVSANWQDILAYSKERAEISSLIKDPLDTTLRASFANMVNQEFTVDKNGILGRKKVSETSDEFEDEQVRLINNLLIFTDDNWETAKTALGKIYYTDEDGNTITSYGLIAETIIGSLIMGERLRIKNENSTVEIGAEGITIKKSDGTIVFQATPDGELIVRNYASQSSVDELEGRVESAEASLEVQAGQIALKASKSSVDALTNRVSSAETSITQNANAIKLKASQSSVDELEGRVESAEASLETMADSIEAKVSSTYGNSSSSFGWKLNSSGFEVYSNKTTVMKITSSEAVFSGRLSAASGTFAGSVVATNDINSENKTLINQNGIYFGNPFKTDAPSYIGESEYSINNEGGQWAMSNIGIYSAPFIYVNKIAYDSNGLWYLHGWSIDYDTITLRASYGGDGVKITKTGVQTTSDRNAKNNIRSFSEQYDILFDNLHPRIFMYNYDDSLCLHSGYIAQEVEDAILAAGLSARDFAAVCIDKADSGNEVRRLRYDEFISLNTWQIQLLKLRVTELENLISQLTKKE